MSATQWALVTEDRVPWLTNGEAQPVHAGMIDVVRLVLTLSRGSTTVCSCKGWKTGNGSAKLPLCATLDGFELLTTLMDVSRVCLTRLYPYSLQAS